MLLTRDVGGLGPSWGYFIVAGGAALLVAALVAWQMSRRMARPLVEAMNVTGRIASGELESRVPVGRHDYPEFTSLAGSINDMAQSLEDSRGRERQLLLAVSHDLRTPLTSIRGFAEAIEDGAIEDSRAGGRRDHRGVATPRAPRGRPARPDQARGAPDVDLHAPHRRGRGGLHDGRGIPAGRRQERAADRAARARRWRGARCRATPRRPFRQPVAADPDRLAQLLANLLENALTFARSTVTVSLIDRTANGECVITVEDDGPGIAPGDLERVFERFYRADRGPNRQMGSGLGLAIVAELASAMGGSVRAESPLSIRRWFALRRDVASVDGDPFRSPECRAGRSVARSARSVAWQRCDGVAVDGVTGVGLRREPIDAVALGVDITTSARYVTA